MASRKYSANSFHTPKWPTAAGGLVMVICLQLAFAQSVQAQARNYRPIRGARVSDRIESRSIATVSLYKKARLRVPEVRVRDVAKVYSRNHLLAQEIGAIELEDLWETGLEQGVTWERAAANTLITARRLKLRLLIAGYGEGDIRFEGADECQLLTGNGDVAQASLEQGNEAQDDEQAQRQLEIVQAVDTAAASQIRQLVSSFYRIDENDVEVQLTSSIKFSNLESKLIEPEGIDWKRQLQVMTDAQSLLGTVQVKFGVRGDNRIVDTAVANVEVAIFREIAVTQGSISKGEVFSVDNVYLRKQRFRTDSFNQYVGKEIFGRIAERNMGAAQQIRVSDFRSERIQGAVKNLVRANQKVVLIALSGNIRVVQANATALQSGSVGQMIQVRNDDSRQIVTGRIASSGEVYVLY